MEDTDSLCRREGSPVAVLDVSGRDKGEETGEGCGDAEARYPSCVRAAAVVMAGALELS